MVGSARRKAKHLRLLLQRQEQEKEEAFTVVFCRPVSKTGERLEGVAICRVQVRIKIRLLLL